MKVNVVPKPKMKQTKLIVHQPNFSEEDLIINPKDFPNVNIGDVMEIYHPDNDFSRLLLQVTSLKEFQQKDAVSVKQSIANTFQLRTYADVIVNVVNIKDVTLDSVELTFKDQYLGRSDMWRLKKNLENTCAYLNKKIEFCGIRCEVFEMWSQGDRVACGVITNDTKIVFRSSTSQVYLFIQMSSEMWDTDINGDLYFEKAVNGFLADLFVKWKKNSSSHEVTIVLFSRTYYEAQTIEEFPEFMRDCLQQDYKGRFYEDFYRVAVQNERYDDWTVILVELKRLFNKYPSSVLEYHKSKEDYIPKAVNSTAAQGNFLEVLNMSLNVFEKHYLDRSFDRTGQLSVVITPGVGVFEVDRELTNITKQRIIDNGVGSDLVCLGEQPLHAVPLFKFHNKNILSSVDDYSMPHWINLSFYSSSKQATYSSFVPRIKLPPMKTKVPKDMGKGNGLITRSKQVKYEDTSFPSLIDYDAYDAQVFKLPSAHISGPHNTLSLQRAPSRKKSDQTAHHQPKQMPPYRKFSEADICLFQSDLSGLPLSAAINIPSLSSDHSSSSSSSTSAFNTEVMKIPQPPAGDEWEDELSPPPRTIIGSAGSSISPQGLTGPFLRPGRALINPFDPSHVTIKLTSNRRRWTHVFPLGPTGIFMQQHHYQAVPHNTTSNANENENRSLLISSSHSDMMTSASTEMRRRRSLISQRPSESDMEKERETTVSASSSAIEIPPRSRTNPGRSSMHAPEVSGDRSLILLWGATGEQEWTPALTTGVDWKSLTIPACLPLTTDYFPDTRSLQNDYVVSDYTLLPDEVNVEIALQMELTQKPLTTEEVFGELVSQRLQQGFQQIVFPKQLMASNVVHISSSPANSSLVRTRTRTETDPIEEYVLSIGRIFHKVSLMGSTITVTCFRPRHPYPTMNIHYLYRFQAPRMDTYEVSWVNFKSERLENYNWNYLDHYICWRGQGDFGLIESLKYWRFRMVLLPIQPAIRKLLEETDHCDCYQPMSWEEIFQMVDGFCKFLEVVNRLKKPFSNRKTRKSGTFAKPLISRTSQSQINSFNSIHLSQSQFLTNSIQQGSNFPPFRERGGSNRLPERPRPRSGSKIIERVRSESGNGGRISPAGEIFDIKQISTSSLSLDTGTESLTGQTIEIQDDRNAINHVELQKLSLSSSLTEILDAMKNSNDGIGFFSQQRRLPPMSFVSAEAAFWIMEHVDGSNILSTAIGLLEKMLDEGLICHASGNHNQPIVFGFVLYYVVDKTKENELKQIIDLAQFQKDWVEVAVDLNSLQMDRLSNGSFNLTDRVTSLYYGDGENEYNLTYKEGNLEMEPSEKVNRAEWGHTRYHHMFHPNVAFEISVQWMVATSSIITEVVQNWARKANLYGFHLIPIPSDPFAFPFSLKSDPLRGPIFVALNCDVLLSDLDYFYLEVEESLKLECAEQMFRFQEAITQQFGFIPCLSDGGSTQSQYQFIHSTGSMFLMIISPSKKREICKTLGISRPIKSPMSVTSSVSSPHENYITRHVMGKQTKQAFEEKSNKQKVGFYWSWNYMLTKRWKTSGVAVDDPIANKIFRDFQDFCCNKQNRLKEFWKEWQQISFCTQLT